MSAKMASACSSLLRKDDSAICLKPVTYGVGTLFDMLCIMRVSAPAGQHTNTAEESGYCSDTLILPG